MLHSTHTMDEKPDSENVLLRAMDQLDFLANLKARVTVKSMLPDSKGAFQQRSPAAPELNHPDGCKSS